jgi:hypothetical protein
MKRLFGIIYLFLSFYPYCIIAQNTGIGLTAPLSKLHVANGASGLIPYSQFSPLAVESNGHTYINLLSPTSSETAILFGSGTSTNGVLMYNNISTPNGFQFRTNGNITRMVLDNSGKLGVGLSAPLYPLDVNGSMRLTGISPNYPGLWLNDGINRAFIGLQDFEHVGLYGSPFLGWGFTMNTGTGALKINGSEGISGQLLKSNGSGPARWVDNPVTEIFNGTEELTSTDTIRFPFLAGPSPWTPIPGLSKTLTLTQPAKLIVQFAVLVVSTSDGPYGTADGICGIDVYVDNIPRGEIRKVYGNYTEHVTGSRIFTLNPGAHSVKVSAVRFGGSGVKIGSAPGDVGSYMTIQLIPYE